MTTYSITSCDENGCVEITIRNQKGFQAAYNCLHAITPRAKLATVYRKLIRQVFKLSTVALTIPPIVSMSLNERKKLRDKSLKVGGWAMEIIK